MSGYGLIFRKGRMFPKMKGIGIGRSGWHGEHERHRQAAKLGHAGGLYHKRIGSFSSLPKLGISTISFNQRNKPTRTIVNMPSGPRVVTRNKHGQISRNISKEKYNQGVRMQAKRNVNDAEVRLAKNIASTASPAIGNAFTAVEVTQDIVTIAKRGRVRKSNLL